MQKGAIPVPHLVAIIFAIIVIAVILYLFFTERLTFTTVIDEKYCDAKAIEFCAKKAIGEVTDWATYEEKCQGIKDDPGC